MDPHWDETAKQLRALKEYARQQAGKPVSKKQSTFLKGLSGEIFGPKPEKLELPKFDFSHWIRMELWPLEYAVYFVLEERKPKFVSYSSLFPHQDKSDRVGMLYQEASAAIRARGLPAIRDGLFNNHVRPIEFLKWMIGKGYTLPDGLREWMDAAAPQIEQYPSAPKQTHDQEMRDKCRSYAKGRVLEHQLVSIRRVIQEIQEEPMVANRQGAAYSDKTVRKYIADVFPDRSRKPGRPKYSRPKLNSRQ